jgi:hypothetical protein
MQNNSEMFGGRCSSVYDEVSSCLQDGADLHSGKLHSVCWLMPNHW